ncbi:MAG: DUF1854 domain-containing protein [Cytophagales bacterium]|nr:DUF1854 domain-containing protein [Armatimonadota bacterium]
MRIPFTSFADADVPIPLLATPDAPKPADASVEYVALNPERIRLFRSGVPGDVTVRLTVDDPALGPPRSWRRVQIARAFPLSKPDEYIGLRDAADKDVGTLATLVGLDAESRRIVDEELLRRYFLPVILLVHDVKEEFGTTTWDVDTDKGRKTFIVQNLRESVWEMVPNQRAIITDKDGLRYEFPDVARLDAKSYNVLSRVL